MTKVGIMKKTAGKLNKTKTAQRPSEANRLAEPMHPYNSIKAFPSLKDFTYSEFKKISDKGWFKYRAPKRIIIDKDHIISTKFISIGLL